MKPIIEVKKIGKKYDITHMKGGYVSLRDVVAGVFKNPFSFVQKKAKQIIGLEKKEDFWAIKDISFNVEKGEVVGVIGSNGAGKSTLLKILTGITPPTEGEAIIRGRVGSLLEVGTGFHPELSGRDNIFLNGAILGMKKKEIAKKFDEIVAFAGIEKFLDTPVKHYSSGMYVRLAFSVAAHMDPEILLIDEVLAVGDAEFQKRCLGKMDQITKEQGRTILFVSHNLSAIQQLCKKTIVLEQGKIVFEGDTEKAIEYYTQHQNGQPTVDLRKTQNRRGTGDIKLTGFRIENEGGDIVHAIKSNTPASFIFSYECPSPDEIENVDMSFSIDKKMSLISVVYNSYTKEVLPKLKTSGDIKFNIKKVPFAPGIYGIGVRVLVNGIEADWPKGAIGSFEVLPSDEYVSKGFRTNPDSAVIIDGFWS